MLKRLTLSFAIILLLLLSACDSPTEEPPGVETKKPDVETTETTEAKPQGPPAKPLLKPLDKPADLLNEPIALQRFESVAEALPVWRQYADEQPTLLLLSGSPQLIPPPTDLLDQVDYLLNKGTHGAIRNASEQNNPDALLRASMAVDVALRNRWFSQLSWVLPMRDLEQTPDLEAIRAQFVERGMLYEQEAASLLLNGQVINGIVRDTPLVAGNISQLAKSDSPVVLHIDLGYFQALYKNEIATPLLQTLFSTLAALKELHLQTLAVTFAYGHMDNQIALDVRFVGEILAALIEDPELLNKPVPANWQRQADSIYLTNFFQKEKIDELHKAQEQDDPDAAWVKFNLYRSAATQKQGEQALKYLAEAVEIDPIYAYEYGNLARMAYDSQRPDETMRMFSLASRAFPDDPFIKLRMAELAAQLGDAKTALHLVEQLQALNWSSYYYPNMPTYLDEFKEGLEAKVEQGRGTVNEERGKS